MGVTNQLPCEVTCQSFVDVVCLYFRLMKRPLTPMGLTRNLRRLGNGRKPHVSSNNDTLRLLDLAQTAKMRNRIKTRKHQVDLLPGVCRTALEYVWNSTLSFTKSGNLTL